MSYDEEDNGSLLDKAKGMGSGDSGMMKKSLLGVVGLVAVLGVAALAQQGKIPIFPEQCETPKSGGACFSSVMWARENGIKEQPQWYPGLAEDSSFESFQKVISQNEHSKCQKPCEGKFVSVEDITRATHAVSTSKDVTRATNAAFMAKVVTTAQTTAMPTTTKQACQDEPGFQDAGGDDCNYYAQGSNCADFGRGYPSRTTGHHANEACCACGGGTPL